MGGKRVALMAILAGGPLAGVLVASALPPQMKPPLDSPWRTASRERALEIDSYAFVDTSPNGYGPQVPWAAWLRPASTAPFPEDFYRARDIPMAYSEPPPLATVSYTTPPIEVEDPPQADPEIAMAGSDASELAADLHDEPAEDGGPPQAFEHAPAEEDPIVDFGG